ncbi:MAG: TolC family protein [Paludibacteraceae bacterium]|nr:TolC family protein [Paludibacteraceae bacterium]
MKKIAFTIIVSLLSFTYSFANDTILLSLDYCHQKALEGNKQAQIDKENQEAAKYMRKAALAKFFPKVTANGAYVWVQNNLYMMSDEHEFSFGKMNNDGTFTFNPNIFNTYFPGLDASVSQWVADEYMHYREETKIDINHVLVGQVGVTQPVFLGGKIVQMYKIAKAYEQIEGIKSGKSTADILVNVDEAYWRVISVEQKLQLAEKYCSMLEKVVEDITTAEAEGTMTKGDLLKVKVKLNEAQVSRQKAEDGLRLSKMALCQIIGMPLDSEIKLDDSQLNSVSLETISDPNMDEVWGQRKELQLLEQADKIAKAGVKITASGLMPNIVANASYVTSNPNFFNGFFNNNSFGGTFMAGVVVNVPIAHADDILQLKAAKHKAKVVELQLEEAKEKIELQITQTSQQLTEANRKLVMATSNIENAEENLRMAQAAFDEGMLTSTELLGAQTAWLKAYSEKIDAAIDVRMYEVYLKQHSGKL